MKTIVLMFLAVQVAIASAGFFDNILSNLDCKTDDRRPCKLNDDKCITEASQRAFKDYQKGDWKTIDPIHENEIPVQVDGLSYTLSDVTLSGMSTCTPELVKLNVKPDKITYDYHLNCKSLKLTGNCKINGILGPHTLDGDGVFEVDYDNSIYKFSGELDKGIYCDTNNKVRVNSHVLNDIEALGTVKYYFKDLYRGDADKTAEIQNYMNENWYQVDKLTRKPDMEQIMNTFMTRLAVYHETFSYGCIFYHQN